MIPHRRLNERVLSNISGTNVERQAGDSRVRSMLSPVLSSPVNRLFRRDRTPVRTPSSHGLHRDLNDAASFTPEQEVRPGRLVGIGAAAILFSLRRDRQSPPFRVRRRRTIGTAHFPFGNEVAHVSGLGPETIGPTASPTVLGPLENEEAK